MLIRIILKYKRTVLLILLSSFFFPIQLFASFSGNEVPEEKKILKDYNYQLKMGSLLSYHTYLSNYDFKNKVTKNGRIIASPLYLQLEKNYKDYGFHLFLSTDSIASPILGIMAETVIDESPQIKTSLFGGGYFVSASAWSRVQNHPKYFTSLIKNRLGFAVPVVGYKAEYTLYQAPKYRVSSVLAISLTLVHLGFFFNIPL